MWNFAQWGCALQFWGITLRLHDARAADHDVDKRYLWHHNSIANDSYSTNEFVALESFITLTLKYRFHKFMNRIEKFIAIFLLISTTCALYQKCESNPRNAFCGEYSVWKFFAIICFLRPKFALLCCRIWLKLSTFWLRENLSSLFLTKVQTNIATTGGKSLENVVYAIRVSKCEQMICNNLLYKLIDCDCN